MKRVNKFVKAVLFSSCVAFNMYAQSPDIYNDIQEVQKKLESPTEMELVYSKLSSIDKNMSVSRNANTYLNKVAEDNGKYKRLSLIKDLEKQNEFFKTKKSDFYRKKLEENKILISKYRKELEK